jgi:hypothetical protein
MEHPSSRSVQRAAEKAGGMAGTGRELEDDYITKQGINASCGNYMD